MRSLALATLVLSLVAVPSAEACDCGGCPPTSCGTSSTAVPGSGLLIVRPFGQLGPLQAFELATGKHRFALPPGVLSASGRLYVSRARSGEATTLRVYDARHGRLLRTWTTPGKGWTVAALSGSGRHAALLDAYARRGTASLQIVDTRNGLVENRAVLRGSFDVDAISNDGLRLFLIQYLRNGYLVRKYDVAGRSLAVQPLTEKGAPMQGLAWNAVASRDGRYLLTLYLRGDGAAEVHTLDLERGTAICIDLPRGDALAVRQYALSLAPHGRTLYAANPSIGVVATVDLRAKRVTQVTHFRSHEDYAQQTPSAVTSHDGRTVYFTNGRRLYAFDAAYDKTRVAADPGGPVSGLAFTSDDRRLLVVRRDARIVWLVAATGRRAG